MPSNILYYIGRIIGVFADRLQLQLILICLYVPKHDVAIITSR